MSNFVIITHSQSNGDLLFRRGDFQAKLQAKHPGWFAINCAVGGATVEEWMPAAGPSKLAVSNFDNALGLTLEAIEEGNTPSCIVCIIGESDAKDPATANAFRQSLWQSLAAFRAAIGYPKLRVIVVVLGTKPDLVNGKDLFKAWGTIQTQQKRMNVNHPGYIIIEGNEETSQYDPGAPYCHRTPAAQMLMADLIVQEI